MRPVQPCLHRASVRVETLNLTRTMKAVQDGRGYKLRPVTFSIRLGPKSDINSLGFRVHKHKRVISIRPPHRDTALKVSVDVVFGEFRVLSLRGHGICKTLEFQGFGLWC